MARLILLNGAPGSGKTTLAQRFADSRPLTLVLELDAVRAMLGRWLDQPVAAGLIAREMGVHMARTQLIAGRDVIVPQFLGRVDFILQLQALCDDVDAAFIEVALLSDADDVVRRFVRRSATSHATAHRDAAALQDRNGGVEGLRESYDRLLTVVAQRPDTRTVRSVYGQIDATYLLLLDVLTTVTTPGPPSG